MSFDPTKPFIFLPGCDPIPYIGNENFAPETSKPKEVFDRIEFGNVPFLSKLNIASADTGKSSVSRKIDSARARALQNA